MKIAYHTSSNESSIYFYPFKWKDLSRLFESSEPCSVERYHGNKIDVSVFFDDHGCPEELNDFKKQLPLNKMLSIIKQNKIRTTEFTITISGCKLKSVVGGGCLFTTSHEALTGLIAKLKVTQNMLMQAKNCLITIDKKGTVTQVGQFTSQLDLMSYIYSEVKDSDFPVYKYIESPF